MREREREFLELEQKATSQDWSKMMEVSRENKELIDHLMNASAWKIVFIGFWTEN